MKKIFENKANKLQDKYEDFFKIINPEAGKKEASLKVLTALVKKIYSRLGDSRLGRELANAVWSEYLFNGVFQMEIVSTGKNICKSTCTHQFKCSKL